MPIHAGMAKCWPGIIGSLAIAVVKENLMVTREIERGRERERERERGD